MKTRARVRSGERVCLRCDWTGTTAERACPSCGAALWEPQRAAPPKPPSRLARARARRAARAERAARIATGVTAATPAPARDAQERALASDRRGRRRGWLAVTVVVMVALVAVAIVRAGTQDTTKLASTAVIGGRLLYLATDPGTGDPRLFVWNLETGEVRPGPLLEDPPTSMIGAAGVGEDAIGLVTEAPLGGSRVQLLRHVEETDAPAVLLEGDLVAWEYRGETATAATVTPARCDRVVLDQFSATTIEVDRAWAGPICGTLVAVHRTQGVTWFSVEDHRGPGFRGDAIATLSTTGGSGPSSPMLPGWSILATGEIDLYVVPSDPAAPQELGALGSDRSGPLIEYRDEDGSALLVERFLALTWDGRGVYILGSVDGVRGIYRVAGPTEAGLQPLTPRLVMETDADADDVVLTESSRTVPIVSIGGRLSAVGGQGIDQLAVPDGAPSPAAGPILWLVRDESP